MNTVVWVLMMWTGHAWTPVMEFSTEQKCIVGSAKLDQFRRDKSLLSPSINRPVCMSLEK